MSRSLHRFVGILMAVMLAVGLFPPSVVSAAVTWKDAGFASSGQYWLEAGQGLNLATNAEGDDLVLLGRTLTSEGGLAIIEGASTINTRLVPPESGYVKTINTADVEYRVAVVKLADGGYAQVEFGYGWRRGDGFSSLMINRWHLSTAKQESPPLVQVRPQPPLVQPPEQPPLVQNPEQPPVRNPEPTPLPNLTPSPVPAVSACPFEGSQIGQVKELQLPEGVVPHAAVVTNDCHLWVYTDFDRLLHKIRVTDGALLAQVKTGFDFHAGLAYNPANNRLLRADWRNLIEVYEGSTGELVDRFQLPGTGFLGSGSVRGLTADAQTGQVFIWTSNQLWAVDRDMQVRGPVEIAAGAGGLSGRGGVVRGGTLWLLGAPWNDSPAIAVPVDTVTLTPGGSVTLMGPEKVSFVQGFSMDVHPTNGTFYVAGMPAEDIYPFVAVIKDGQVLKQLTLTEFTAPPHIALSPDGEYLVIRNPGASGSVITNRDYTPTTVTETHQLFSIFGSLIIARSSDLSTLAESDNRLTQPMEGWFITGAGKPSATAFSVDGQYLFVTDTVNTRATIYRLANTPIAPSTPNPGPNPTPNPPNPTPNPAPNPQPKPAPGKQQGIEQPVHFQATYVTDTHIRSSGFVYAELKQPDFHLTLKPDGTARVIFTITSVIWQDAWPVNVEYLGTYTLDPLKVTLKLQPPLKGWDTLYHQAKDAQEMQVSGDLAPDLSRIENLVINGTKAKSGSAVPVTETPEPGRAD